MVAQLGQSQKAHFFVTISGQMKSHLLSNDIVPVLLTCYSWQPSPPLIFEGEILIFLLGFS